MNLKKIVVQKGKKIRKRRINLGIKQKLLIYFLLIAIIPIVGITIYSTLSLNQSYTSDRLDQLEAIGANKAAAMESWFEERQGDCDLMSETPTVMEWAEFAGTWGHAQKADAIREIEMLFQSMIDVYGTYKEMMLINTSGHVVAKANMAGYTFAHNYGEDVSHKVYYTYSYAERNNEDYIFLSDIEWDDMVVKDYVAVTTSAPVHDVDGNFVGILVFYIDDAYLNDLMHQTQGLGNSGETYLTDFNGYWLTTSKFSYYVDEGLYDDLGNTIMTELLTTSGIQEALSTKRDVKKSSNSDYRGIAVMGSYSYLEINSEGFPWILVAEIDVSEATKVVDDLTTISILIVVIVAVIVAIIGYVIAKRFTDPIIRLNSSAVKVADGNLTDIGDNGKKARKGNDEIAVLERSFGIMTANIRDIIASFQKSEQKYQSLFENMLEGLALCQIIIDDDNNPVDFIYLEINDAFEKLIGLKKEETIGKRVTEVIPGIKDSEPNLFEIYGKVALTGEDTKFELFFEPLKKWLSISVYSPEKGYFVTVFDNITERKKAEEIIKNEIEKLRELNQMKIDLINRISHELKTPLNAIFGSIQLLMEDFKKDSEADKYRLADVIYKGGNRLKKIIDDLIESSRYELKKIRLKKKRENLNNILKECIEELIFLANKRRIFFDVDLEEDIFLQLDAFRFEQVIINIISNAINNTPPEGRVIIKLNDNIKYIDISIKDTGIGLTEEEREKLFTKFGKIERYGKGLDIDIEGWGLGLYISKEIVQLHGGEILVKSEGRNQGSEFIIRLFKTD